MRIIIIALSFLILAPGVGHAMAEKRVALVIGNGAYKHAPELVNPSNDAGDIAARLKELDFEVVVRLDATLPEMLAALQEFSDKLRSADLALFYYAGHGLQVNGRNYLVPVNARLESHITLDFEAMPVNLVMATMQDRAKTNLLFLDACRNNPMTRSLARSLGTRSSIIGRGLARIGAGTGTFVSFATEPGNVALDGDGENSPYTEALVRHLGSPGKGLAETMVQVRKDVIDSTDGKQVPWEHSSLTGPVVLEKSANEPVVSAPSSNDQFELTFWNSIKDAKSIPYFDTYLKQFPKGRFAALARLRIADLQRLEQVRPAIEEEESVPQNAADEPEPEESTEVAALPAEDSEPVIEAIPKIDPKKDRDFVRLLQRELNRLGCSAGSADGVWGRNTERGLENFGRHSDLASLDLTDDLLDTLKAKKTRVCPLACRQDQKIENGRCVVDTSKTASLTTCVRIAVNAPRTKPNGSNWDPQGENNRIAPDIFITNASTGQSSPVCTNSYWCSWVIRNPGATLNLRVTDKDKIQHDLIGGGSCPVKSGRCSLGRVSVQLTGC